MPKRGRITQHTPPRSPIGRDRTSYTPRRHKVTVACVACKYRKGRCTGKSPCEPCVSLGTVCIIDETLDGRRKVCLNRKVEELLPYRWLLEGLLLSLQTSKDDRLLGLVDLVNHGASLPILAASISASLKTSPELAEPVDLGTLRTGRHSQLSSQNDAPMNGAPNDSGDELVDHMALIRNLDGYAQSALSFDTSAQGWNFTPQSGLCESLYSEHPMTTPTIGNEPLMSGRYPASRSTYRSSFKPLRKQGTRSGNIGLEHVAHWLRSSIVPSSMDFSMSTGPTNILAFRPMTQNSWHSSVSLPMEVSQFQHPSACQHGHGIDPCHTCLNDSWANSVSIAPMSHSSQLSLSESSSPCHDTDAVNSMTSSAIYSDAPELSSTPLVSEPLWSTHGVPSHRTLPMIETDEHPMAQAISDFLEEARTKLSNGTLVQDIFGPDKPALDLLYRARNRDDTVSVCNFASELARWLPGLERCTRAAIAHMFTLLIKWMIVPSCDRYAQLPEMYRPTRAQTNRPHSLLVEFCPIPWLRDAQCQRPQRDFEHRLAASISCNWTHGLESCHERDSKTGNLHVTEAFEKHIGDVKNWHVDGEIFAILPGCSH